MAHKISLAGRHIHLPRSRALRMTIGFALLIGGVLGFLPVLGFWMVPLGLLVLSIDIPAVRRARRRFVVWWYRDKKVPARAGRGRSAPVRRKSDETV